MFEISITSEVKQQKIVIISLSDIEAARLRREVTLDDISTFLAFSSSKCLQNSSIIQNISVTLSLVFIW